VTSYLFVTIINSLVICWNCY